MGRRPGEAIVVATAQLGHLARRIEHQLVDLGKPRLGRGPSGQPAIAETPPSTMMLAPLT
jgi:hypothetical protein